MLKLTPYDLILGMGRATASGATAKRDYCRMIEELRMYDFISHRDYLMVYQFQKRFYENDSVVYDYMYRGPVMKWNYEEKQYCFTPEFSKRLVHDLLERDNYE